MNTIQSQIKLNSHISAYFHGLFLIKKFILLLGLFVSTIGYAKIPIQIERSTIENHIAQIESQLQFEYSEELHSQIEDFIIKGRYGTSKLLGRSQVYYPIIEHYLNAYNLPLELKYIATWESKLNPVALSPVSAAGLWQLMPGTAMQYGLIVNDQIDERFDPIKSTQAALKYLIDLHNYLQDWTLAIAAYNCGKHRVRKAIKTSGTMEFKLLKNYLPQETQKYIPSILASIYTAKFYHFFDIRPVYLDYHESQLSTTIINHSINTKQISKIIKIPTSQIQKYNPSFITDQIHSSPNGTYLRLPQKQMAIYIKNQKNKFKKSTGIATFSSTNPHALYTINLICQPGDDIEYLSKLYKVKEKDIIYWNNLIDSKLSPYQELRIHVKVPKPNFNKSYPTHQKG